MKKKTFYNINQVLNNDDGWLFYNAALKNWKYINSKLVGKNILDIGCGGGVSVALLNIFNLDKEIIGFEGNKKLNNIWKKRKINVEVGNIYKLPFKNNCFDTVYSSHVIEHLKYPEKMIRESIRVTSSRIIHIVPDGNVGEKNFGTAHLNVYNRINFLKIFKKFNLKIVDYKSIEDNHMSSLAIVLEK